MSEPLFTQFELSGINALTAGSFDASTEFQAHDPASHVIYSLGVFGRYFSPEPNSRPNAIKVNQSPCPPGEKEYTDILGFKHCGKLLQSDGDAGGQGGSLFGGLVNEGALKRIGLFLLALVLIAVALWKM